MQHLFGTDQADALDAREVAASARPGTRGRDDGVYIRVVVERGIDAGAGGPADAGGAGDGLTYRANGLALQIGQRVEVPLGRGNKLAAGIVTEVGGAELLGDFPASKVKAVVRAMGPALPAPLVELARWMAAYYICPLGIVLGTMLPASVKRGTGTRRLVEVEAVSPSEAAAILAERRLAPSVMKVWAAAAEHVAAQGGKAVEPRMLARESGAKNLGPINRLVEAGLLRRVERNIVRGREQIWQHARVEAEAAPYELTGAQRGVAEGICAALGSFSVHLVRGVTSSGKTEVYMQAIARVLTQRQRALVLVPEIALTPQTAGRFLSRFGASIDDGGEGRVAVLHSGMPASERHRQWALAASGRAMVVVGARSAVFAPLANLGLIVVDEEHAGDYKQDQALRYNGRDVAIKRAHIEACPVVLGSATPSLESWANANSGRPHHFLWQLTERVGGGVLPRVEIVDLAEERRAMARAGRRAVGVAAGRAGVGSTREIEAVGPQLEEALREMLRAGGQGILLLNRRGWSSYICCCDVNCGWVAGCDACDSSMVMHKQRAGGGRGGGGGRGPGERSAVEFVRCHHCQAEQLVPRQCAVCNRKTILLGAGTQRVEEELLRKLGGMLTGDELARVDGDTMRSAADYFRVLSRFGTGEVKVLLGTQMIAKGLDFPNVRLVGVINADTGLSMPDFRAGERTFQLVSQVAGRAGRGAHVGRVLVQTMNPGEPAIHLAAQHDYITFINREMRLRRQAGLPPVSRMARIVVRDESPSRAEGHARRIAEALRSAAPACLVQGPAPCPIARIAGEYRAGVEIFAVTAGLLRQALNTARGQGLFRTGPQTAVDVDPAAML